ncbi:transposase [Phormidium pseudopriestleyi]|uniref:RNA-guided endonuclease InsQ/TnpB family protein n=1 Tax=Phormidium pseudopriestleyi TaxID=1759527 RepID=UPI0030F4920F
MEDLDFRIMAKGMLGKYMLDGGFGQFRSIVKYVCWKLGKFFAEVNSRGTSQECPECSAIVKKTLKVRVHHCLECGLTIDRDVASGLVIRNRGIALISTDGWSGKETVCSGDLAGAPKSSQVPKSRKGTTRKSLK